MKYFFVAFSLLISGTLSAQTGPVRPTVQQNDSAMIAGRAAAASTLADMKSANLSNDTAAFRRYAKQYYSIMRDGMKQSSLKSDLGPATGRTAGNQHYRTVEKIVHDYKEVISPAVLNRAAVISKANDFKAEY